MLLWKKEKLSFSKPEGLLVYTIVLSGDEFLKIQVGETPDGLWFWEVFGKRSEKMFKTADDAKSSALFMAKMMVGEALHNLGLFHTKDYIGDR